MRDGTDPGDLSPDAGPHSDLSTRRRARAAIVYFALAGIGAGITLATGISALWLTMVLALVAVGVFQLLGSWNMAVTDMQAIAIGSADATFAVGHGSATLGYTGWRARPMWQVLVFGADSPPTHQAVITVDAMTGDITGKYEEAVDAP